MNRRPARRKRRPIQPGDLVQYEVPPGPPAEVLALFGGDPQAAITAALAVYGALLQGAGQFRSVLAVSGTGSGMPRATDETLRRRLADVAAQDFFGNS